VTAFPPKYSFTRGWEKAALPEEMEITFVMPRRPSLFSAQAKGWRGLQTPADARDGPFSPPRKAVSAASCGKRKDTGPKMIHSKLSYLDPSPDLKQKELSLWWIFRLVGKIKMLRRFRPRFPKK